MTTPLTGQDTRCPQCSASLADDPRFTVWCPSCHWNALPQGQAPEPPRPGSLELRLFHEVASGSDLRPHQDRAAIAAALLALPVHLVSLATLLGAVWMVTIGNWIADIGAVALLGVAWTGRPRLGSLSQATSGAVSIERHEAPQLWALTDAVADRLGARRADAIVIDARFAANYSRHGLRRRAVLRIGLPLWHSLGEQEQLALLAHAFARGVNGDPRRGFWLGAALDGLAEWARMLRPPQGQMNVRNASIATLVALASWALLYLVDQLVLLYLRLLHRVTRISSRRADYLADSLSLGLAGRAAALGLIEAQRLNTAFETLLHQRTIAARGLPLQRRGVQAREQAAAEFWAELRSFTASVPATERGRRIVVAALTHDGFDGTHPPLHLRHAFVAGLPAGEPAVVLDVATAAAIDAELRPAGTAIAKRLLDR